MAKRKRRKGRRFPTADIVPIVGDALIAGPVAEGAGIPLLILDCRERSDLSELIRVHQHLPPGDVRFQWGQIDGRSDDVILELRFERPIETTAILRFSIEDQGILVEAALTGKAVYLQAGRPGDRLIHDPDRPKLLVELPETGFRPTWDNLFINRMTEVVSKRLGVPRKRAEPHARRLIDELRTVTGFRMPRK